MSYFHQSIPEGMLRRAIVRKYSVFPAKQIEKNVGLPAHMSMIHSTVSDRIANAFQVLAKTQASAEHLVLSQGTISNTPTFEAEYNIAQVLFQTFPAHWYLDLNGFHGSGRRADGDYGPAACWQRR
jgi:hypothetical protein